MILGIIVVAALVALVLYMRYGKDNTPTKNRGDIT